MKVLLSLFILICVVAVYAFFIEPNRIKIDRRTLPFTKTDGGGGLKNFKLLHLSDLHIKKIGYREKKLISKVNQIEADLIVITGDFITRDGELEPCLDVLGSIKAKYGIFSILGNEDYSHGNVGILKEKIQELGIEVLVNEHRRADIGGESLYLVGVDSLYFNRDDLVKAMAGVPSNAPTILLAHSPDIVLERGDGLMINLYDHDNRALRGWGWQDGRRSKSDGCVYFGKDGQHTLRIQRREDGVAIDQIVMSSEKYLSHFPEEKDLALETLNNPDEIVINVAQVADEDVHGDWKKYRDSGTSSGFGIADMPDRGRQQLITQINPENYFEVHFNAVADKKYHVWLRMKANRNSIRSDSVYLQFNDSVDSKGNPIYQIRSSIDNQHLKQVHLILSGHTHGGQVILPFIGAVKTFSALGNGYNKGLFEINGTKLFINRGIGMSVFPIRFLCPPEIAVFSFK